ncbi:hypothetical protein SDJN03_21825, partial [Cucurbita argyrosperma subsp. sororia]
MLAGVALMGMSLGSGCKKENFSLPGNRHLPSSSVPPSLPPHLDRNLDPTMPSNQMLQFDDLWISAAFELSAIPMPPEMNIP